MTTQHPPGSPDRLSGLDPVAGTAPRVLILGSFPSRASLAKKEYYGNPKNQFWPMMERLFSIPAGLRYPDRIDAPHGERRGTLGRDPGLRTGGQCGHRIRNPLPNDIRGFVQAHPTLRLVALNGSTAGRYYVRFNDIPGVPSVVLPSTSPANARLLFAEKVSRWEAVKIRSAGESGMKNITVPSGTSGRSRGRSHRTRTSTAAVYPAIAIHEISFGRVN